MFPRMSRCTLGATEWATIASTILAHADEAADLTKTFRDLAVIAEANVRAYREAYPHAPPTTAPTMAEIGRAWLKVRPTAVEAFEVMSRAEYNLDHLTMAEESTWEDLRAAFYKSFRQTTRGAGR